MGLRSCAQGMRATAIPNGLYLLIVMTYDIHEP
jgi:hypothetical protein